ncbi:hypothetical protein GUJ93_ZPchr0013g34248 [Zizania palustris]|uniref:Uncharacterized protein n=1 Tax=Zizania palustris TaxID=103762 RepID=A0A8J6C000_ZIZPA|nr:hypothetical protein GUJ93_ZPchr0013g34248 [Zizania palustris]
MPMGPYGVPPGPPQCSCLPFFQDPPMQADDFAAFAPRPHLPQQPSYVKSAAPTVIKRPLAQHTPELTAMVPASVSSKERIGSPQTEAKVVGNTSGEFACYPVDYWGTRRTTVLLLPGVLLELMSLID